MLRWVTPGDGVTHKDLRKKWIHDPEEKEKKFKFDMNLPTGLHPLNETGENDTTRTGVRLFVSRKGAQWRTTT